MKKLKVKKMKLVKGESLLDDKEFRLWLEDFNRQVEWNREYEKLLKKSPRRFC